MAKGSLKFPGRIKIEFLGSETDALGALMIVKTLAASCFHEGCDIVTIELADLSMYARPHNFPGYIIFKKKIPNGTRMDDPLVFWQFREGH